MLAADTNKGVRKKFRQYIY